MAKILIAEDDRFLENVYLSKLQKEGFDVELAINGEEAIEKVKTFNPDLLVLDIMMPRKNGLEVLKELKEDPKYKDLPIIITTNLDQSVDVDKGMEMGASDYLVKSNVSISDIVDKIRKNLPS